MKNNPKHEPEKLTLTQQLNILASHVSNNINNIKLILEVLEKAGMIKRNKKSDVVEFANQIKAEAGIVPKEENQE